MHDRPRVRAFFVKSLISLALLSVPALAASVDAPAVPILAPLPATQLEPRAELPDTVTRQQLVAVDTAPVATAERLRLDLFAGVSLVVQLERVIARGPDRLSWIGRVEGVHPSLVTLVVDDGQLVGNIRAGRETYTIRVQPNGEQVVAQLDQDQFEPCGGAVPVFNGPAPLTDADVTSSGDTGDVIDVMVVYTESAANGSGNILAEIQLGIDETNQSYANSGVDQRISLARAAEVVYAESGDLGTDLGRLRDPSDGILDEVHGWRDEACADAVSLWTYSGNACGVAYMMTNVSTTFAPWAFSVVKLSCATGYYSFGHELGHNMGSHHDPYVTSDDGAYAYSHGTVNVADRWRTVMAYNTECSHSGTSCTRIQYWSTPLVDRNGDPLGDTTLRDNVRSLDNTAPTVANFRDSSSCVLAVPSGSVTAQREVDNVRLSWGVACGPAWDYTIHQGDLDQLAANGTFTHGSLVCEDLGADLTESFLPGDGNRYFLVVPRTADGTEGGYGHHRPQGTDAAGCGLTGHRPGECP
jgi:hypothetical protein